MSAAPSVMLVVGHFVKGMRLLYWPASFDHLIQIMGSRSLACVTKNDHVALDKYAKTRVTIYERNFPTHMISDLLYETLTYMLI